MLSVSVMGACQIDWKGSPVQGISLGKPLALLIWLAMNPGLHRREALADIFWPNLSGSAARLNLRQTLFQLRANLMDVSGQEFITAGRNHLGLDLSSPIWVDALAFSGATGPLSKEASGEDSLQKMANQVALYRGPLLNGLVLPECEAFNDWLSLTNEMLQRRALDYLSRLADGYESQANYLAALQFALRHVELEPWGEPGYERVMRLFFLDGQSEAALRQFDQCVRLLERELGARPSARLEALAAQIRRNELTPELIRPTAVESVVAPIPPATLSARISRRPVTALYCNLHAADSGELEEALEALQAPLSLCLQIIQKYAGNVFPGHGGGLLCYFGYPQAVDNSSLSALRAACEMVAAVPRGVEIRIGVHSGLIVSGDSARVPDPVGVTSNLAMGLTQWAADREIVVSERTCKRVHSYFDFEPVAHRPGSGPMAALSAFRLIEKQSSLDRTAPGPTSSPRVGREDEMAQLSAWWAEARQGAFKAVWLGGEAGIGKTRLAGELELLAEKDEAGVLALRCFPDARYSPFNPFIRLLFALCEIRREDSVDQKTAKVQRFLQRRFPDTMENAGALFGWMLGLDISTDKARIQGNARLALNRLWVDLLLGLARERPLLLVFEDLHWADESSREVVALLLGQRPAAPILLLLTERSGGDSCCVDHWASVNKIMLPALAPEAVDALLKIREPGLDEGQRTRIIARAEGVPFFAEALIDTAREKVLPFSINDALMVRLDHLASHGAALSVVQLAATLGRDFDCEFLGAVSTFPLTAVNESLQILQEAELVTAVGGGRYRFKHALIQEVTYGSQSAEVRKISHRRIASALEKLPGDLVKTMPEMLAQHWSAAGEASKAMACWLAAGKLAAGHFAYQEAVAHYSACQELLYEHHPSAWRDQIEFDLLVCWARSEQMVSGYGGDRAREMLSRAMALHSRGVGDSNALFNLLWGFWESSGSSIGHREAARLARSLIEVAENGHQETLLHLGLYALGSASFWTGEFAEASAALTQAIAMEVADAPPVRTIYGHHIPVACRAYLALIASLLGNEQASNDYSQTALELAKACQDTVAQVFALTFAANLKRWQGRPAEAKRLALEGRTLAQSCNNHVFEALLAMVLVWCDMPESGQSALDELKNGVALIRQSFRHILVVAQSIVIDALLMAGEYQQALVLIEETLAEAEGRHDRHFLAELHRLKGRALLHLADSSGSEEAVNLAISIGKAQGAAALLQRAQQDLAALTAQI
ncbi:MAG: AAA family ATPase [Zoogloea sp.]|uniref:AAA family ATPase n=1 Tax=Zoogloea sp. TaxID=49181 RepID=UPI003F38017C